MNVTASRCSHSGPNFLIAIAICFGSFLPAQSIRAQSYPEKPIRLNSPYAPGGSNDLVTRLVGKSLGDALHTPVVVENRPGGGMLIATEMVARVPADGYILLLASSGHAVNPIRDRLPAHLQPR